MRQAGATREPYPAPIRVSDDVLADLHARLDRVRWPAQPLPGWEHGADAETLRELVRFWRKDFDWRRQERLLEEQLPSYRAQVRGLDVHVALRPGKGPRPFPLLLLHGWPGSHFEMIKVAGPLADPGAHAGDPADAFDLVIPSLPGHGFSQAPSDPLFGADDCADLLRDLMVDVLGHHRFGAQGGDRGAFVAASLAHRHPDNVAAIHLNLATGIPAPPGERSEAEERWLAEQAHWFAEEGGYSSLQSTRPQTLAFALSDSPVGLAAWIVEKWRAWSDCDGEVLRRFSADELLTNVMLYWVTQTIASSCRLYCENRRGGRYGLDQVVKVPTGVAVFPKEIYRAPRRFAEPRFNLVHWSVQPRGGHFAAFEQPELFVEDVRAFFRKVR